MPNYKAIAYAKFMFKKGYSEQYIDADMLSKRYSVDETKEAIAMAKGEIIEERLINVEVKDPNKFMKILIACGITIDQMSDRTWYITELHPHEYHCTGYHPVGARIDVIKSGIVIH